LNQAGHPASRLHELSSDPDHAFLTVLVLELSKNFRVSDIDDRLQACVMPAPEAAK
jgi:hypothetical protein